MLTELAPSQRKIESWEWTNEVRTGKTLFFILFKLILWFSAFVFKSGVSPTYMWWRILKKNDEKILQRKIAK
jgi:hypothetical protein